MKTRRNKSTRIKMNTSTDGVFFATVTRFGKTYRFRSTISSADCFKAASDYGLGKTKLSDHDYIWFDDNTHCEIFLSGCPKSHVKTDTRPIMPIFAKNRTQADRARNKGYTGQIAKYPGIGYAFESLYTGTFAQMAIRSRLNALQGYTGIMPEYW